MVDQSIQRQDAEGSRALIDEHVGNLVYQIDRLLDIIADLEAEAERKDTIIDDLRNQVAELEQAANR